MIRMSDESTLENLRVNGKNYPKIIVEMSGTSGATVRNNIIENAKNNLTTLDNTYYKVIGIHGNSANNYLITKNSIKKIGFPKINHAAWPEKGQGAGIYLPSSRNGTVTYNTIRWTLTAGIDLTGTINADISYNNIYDVALNYQYDAATQYTGDAITAYHNLTNPSYVNYIVYGNYIRRSYNHGIHLSGKHLDIRYNDIGDVRNASIYVGDWREPVECSSVVWIQHNKVVSGWGYRKSIKGNNYKETTFWPSANIGDVDENSLFFGDDSCILNWSGES